MAMFHAYFDESGKQSDHPVVSFTGVVVPQTRLQRFDDEWRALLRLYEIDSLHMARASRLSEKHGSKMSRGQTADQRTDALIPFADCINEHLEVGLIQAWDINGFAALEKSAKYALGSVDDPYLLAFGRAMTELGDYLKGDEKLSLICDDDRATALDCHKHYRGIKHAWPEIGQRAVSLTFADDKYFPALQAADMVAFLSRLEAKSRFYGDIYSYRRLFRHLTTEKGEGYMKWFALFADEQTQKSIWTQIEKKLRPNAHTKK